MIKLRQKALISPQNKVFMTSKQPFTIHFILASCNVCPVGKENPDIGIFVDFPEIFAQTQGSDYWQLIHSHYDYK